MEEKNRCGYVALVGRPNAGKSTLLNQLIGEKVAIVSDKPQTTRNRILGIRSGPGHQMIFVDTPGIHRPGYRLNERMMDIVHAALKEVDVVVHVVDVSEKFGKGEQYAVDLCKVSGKPLLLALNKVDVVNKGRVLPVIQAYADFSVYDEIVPVSAVTGDNVDALVKTIADRLPEREFAYPPGQFTDQVERDMVTELIREKVLRHTRQELPYSTAVRLDLFDESRREEGFVHIGASIVVDKESQKKIVIGRAGRMIKQIGIEARKDIEELLAVSRIFLDLHVKVEPGWRDSDHLLDAYNVR